MANVLGIPLLKGNSQVIVSGLMRNTLPSNVFAGKGVSFHQNNEGVNINFVDMNDADAAAFAGFVVETNECANTCTVIRAGEMVPLPRNLPVTNGDQLILSSATGLPDAAGDTPIAGVIINDGNTLTFVNGKNGSVYPDGYLANLSLSPVFPAAPPLASAAKSKPTLTDK